MWMCCCGTNLGHGFCDKHKSVSSVIFQEKQFPNDGACVLWVWACCVVGVCVCVFIVCVCLCVCVYCVCMLMCVFIVCALVCVYAYVCVYLCVCVHAY